MSHLFRQLLSFIVANNKRLPNICSYVETRILHRILFLK